MGPIQERLDSCRQFIERAKKCVLRADEVITRAVELKAIFETEVAQAEQRLALLQAEAVAKLPQQSFQSPTRSRSCRNSATH